MNGKGRRSQCLISMFSEQDVHFTADSSFISCIQFAIDIDKVGPIANIQHVLLVLLVVEMSPFLHIKSLCVAIVGIVSR